MNKGRKDLHTTSSHHPRKRFVAYLPDLITEEDYLDPPEKRRIRVRIDVTSEGVEVLGDSMYAPLLEELLTAIGAEEIERMLCG